MTDRQMRLNHYDQQARTEAKVILIGAGGLGGEIGEAEVRKGIGSLVIFDPDLVELSNLNRQKFYEHDLYKPKAHRLALNLAREGFSGSVIEGYSLSFEDALQQGIDVTGTVAIVGVDSNPCRIAASVYFRERHIPCIFTAVSEQADHGFVFVQKPEGPCFGCLFPGAINDETYPCPGTPAVKDILKVVGGIVSYALDSLLMKRLRCWDYADFHLDGSVPANAWRVAKRPDCKLCRAPQNQPQIEGGRV